MGEAGEIARPRRCADAHGAGVVGADRGPAQPELEELLARQVGDRAAEGDQPAHPATGSTSKRPVDASGVPSTTSGR
ncbi:hypothetical protein B4Q13_23170, partial [Lacticaseibacillus rhamnosus]